MLPLPLLTLALAVMSLWLNVCSRMLPLPLALTATVGLLLPPKRLMAPSACKTMLPPPVVVRSDWVLLTMALLLPLAATVPRPTVTSVTVTLMSLPR